MDKWKLQHIETSHRLRSMRNIQNTDMSYPVQDFLLCVVPLQQFMHIFYLNRINLKQNAFLEEADRYFKMLW